MGSSRAGGNTYSPIQREGGESAGGAGGGGHTWEGQDFLSGTNTKQPASLSAQGFAPRAPGMGAGEGSLRAGTADASAARLRKAS